MVEDVSPVNERVAGIAPAKVFMEAFEAIVFAVDDMSDEDKEKLCLYIWIDAHHPLLCKYLFVKILPYISLPEPAMR